MTPRIIAAAFALAMVRCVGSTGGDLFEFEAVAVGPKDAKKGEAYGFETGRGYRVALDRARLHVGAVYLNQSRPTSVASSTTCQLPGIYVSEVTSGLDVDVLSPKLQPFPATGFTTTDRALTGEIWLTGGDVNDPSDSTVILDVAGTATRGDETFPFEAKLTISTNRVTPPADPALPGAHPICKQRIVAPIPIDLVPRAGGKLVLRVDPRGWFSNVDFSRLEPRGDSPVYRFADDSEDPASRALYSGLRASVGAYRLSWLGGEE